MKFKVFFHIFFYFSWVLSNKTCKKKKSIGDKLLLSGRVSHVILVCLTQLLYTNLSPPIIKSNNHSPLMSLTMNLRTSSLSKLIHHVRTICWVSLLPTTPSAPLTLFGPSNAALAAVSPAVRTQLDHNPAAAFAIFSYHIADDEVLSSDFVNEQLLKTKLGLDIRINVYPLTNVSSACALDHDSQFTP